MPSTALHAAGLAAFTGLGFAVAQAAAPDAGGGISILTAGSVGGGVALVVSAIGNSLLVPYLKERGTQAKLDETIARGKDNEKRIAELEAKLNGYECNERKLVEQLADSGNKLALSLDKTNRLAQHLSVMLGDVRAGTFPAAPPLLVGTPETTRPTGPKVLVVEDQEKHRDPLIVMLEAAGCSVEAVATVADGLEALAHGPDVVILDLMLPDGDGIAILRRVRELNLPIKVVVTTGKSEEQLGAVNALAPVKVFRKPIDFNGQLLPAIMGAAA